jgi:hypothetical protein
MPAELGILWKVFSRNWLVSDPLVSVYALRETNGAAHALAKHAVSTRQNQVWLEDIPTLIFPIVLREQVLPRP